MENITHSSSHLFHGSRSTTISGGGFSSSARDHNRNSSVVNIFTGTQTNPSYESALWRPLQYFDPSTGSSNRLAPSADLGWGPQPAYPSNPGSGMGLHVRPPYNDTLNTTGTERILTRRMQPGLDNESVWRPLLSYLGSLISSLSIQRTCYVNNGVQASTEERESPIARYQRHLLVERHGSPLWSPQPHRRLPLSYRQKGISVGDIGVITPQGSFDFLFNICLPRGHPSNPEVLPVGFSPVNLLPTDICELREHDSGSCLLTPSIEKSRGLTYKCNGPEGSILIMPNGAYHEDLLNFQDFKAVASQNAEEWYRFAIETCGRNIKNGQLRLVTGCDKTNSWGIATYSDLQGPVAISLTANSTQPAVEYTWDYEGRVQAKAGPKFEESLDSTGNREYPQSVHNQCTFLRSFTLTLAEDVWKTMPSNLTQDLSDNNNNLGFNHERRVNIRNDSFGSDSDTSTNYPAMVINQMLLSQYPNAKVAISHDNDWCSVIREDETTMPDAPELLGRMRKIFSSHIDDDGTVYISQNHASETKPHLQSCSIFTPERPVYAGGILSDGTGNTRNEDEIFSGSSTAWGKQSEGPPNTVFSEEGIGSDDEGFVHRLALEERAAPQLFLLGSEVPTPPTLVAVGPSFSLATSPTQTSHDQGEGAVLLNPLDMESRDYNTDGNAGILRRGQSGSGPLALEPSNTPSIRYRILTKAIAASAHRDPPPPQCASGTQQVPTRRHGFPIQQVSEDQQRVVKTAGEPTNTDTHGTHTAQQLLAPHQDGSE